MAQPRRRRRRWRIQPGLAALGVLIIGIVLYGVVFPLVTFPEDPRLIRGSAGTLVEAIRLRTLQALAVVWFFFLGACFGSFLNVVVYRVPRRRTLLGSSYCPYCARPIRARHNIPVLGWLLLRGLCYDCRLPISPRYPLVELLVGAVFLSLALVELFSGGRNLPLRPVNYYYGIEWIVFAPQWDLIQIYAFHCAVLGVLLSWALIWYDRQRITVGYGLAALLLATILPLFAPELAFVGWDRAHSTWPLPAGEAFLNSLFGAIAGGIIGAMTFATHRIKSRTHHDPRQARHAARGAACFALAGAALGWQAALSIALLSPIFRLVTQKLASSGTARAAQLWPLSLFAATWLQINVWRFVAWIPGWPSHDSSALWAPVQLVLAMFFSGQISSWLDRESNQVEPLPAAEEPSDVTHVLPQG